jgi:hypothetical protein
VPEDCSGAPLRLVLVRIDLLAGALQTAADPLARLGLVSPDRATRHQRKRDRLSALALARARELLTALGALLRSRHDRVVLVGEARSGADRAREAAAADDQPRPRPIAPEAAYGLELLPEEPQPLRHRREREAERLVLGFHPAGSHPERDAPARDLVRGRGGICEHRRRAKGDRRDERAQLDPLGARRERRDDGPGVERDACGSVGER